MQARQVLAHRGFWELPKEQNTFSAFRRAFAAGFGIETDIRDRDGEVVISHDPPRGFCPSLADLLDLHDDFEGLPPLALNVKSDGLSPLLRDMADRLQGRSYFFFDMSLPDTLAFVRAGQPIYGRHSDLEPSPTFPKASAGVWVDGFFEDWATASDLRIHLSGGKSVCLVSPELHGREPAPVWDSLVATLHEDPGFSICTDHPSRLLDSFA